MTNNYRRRNLKQIILDKIPHAKITSQTIPSKPHLIQSSLLEADVLDQLMLNTNDIHADIECLFNAAKIIRKRQCSCPLRRALVIQIATFLLTYFPFSSGSLVENTGDALQMNDARQTPVKQ